MWWFLLQHNWISSSNMFLLQVDHKKCILELLTAYSKVNNHKKMIQLAAWWSSTARRLANSRDANHSFELVLRVEEDACALGVEPWRDLFGALRDRLHRDVGPLTLDRHHCVGQWHGQQLRPWCLLWVHHGHVILLQKMSMFMCCRAQESQTRCTEAYNYGKNLYSGGRQAKNL